MPIRSPDAYVGGDEQDALLAADEENQRHPERGREPASQNAASQNGGFKGNGLQPGANVKKSTGRAQTRSLSQYKYGAVWERAVHSAVRQKHRLEISEKLRSFDASEFERYRRSEQEIKDCKSKKLRRFLQEQNSRLNDWLEVDAVVRAMAEDVLQSFEPQDYDQDGIAEAGGRLQVEREEITSLLPQDEQQRRQKEARQARIAINVNVAANVLLVVAKAISTVFSSSLSLLASLADSVLDLLMTLIIFSTAKVVAWKSQKLSARYPVGRRRLQPIGTLVFSVIMVVSFLQILQESFQRLFIKPEREAASLPAVAIGSMVGTIVLKGAIWLPCAWQQSSQVQALAQDCKTDVIFNTASLLFPAIGYFANVWWLDPLGAGLLSIYIIFDWAHTCLEHVDHLSGASVGDATLKKLMFLAWRFSPVVKAYKNLKAYHAGDGVWVECDVLLEPDTDLRHAHDVAELMQYCFEGLSEVDRAFVTVDYATQGPTGHASIEPT